jgi:phosphate transport system substrate-binding protein
VAKRIRLVCTAAALVPLTLLAAACSSSSSSAPAASKSSPAVASNATGKSISETGSTLLFPLFGTWQTAYSTADPSVTITSGATG